MSDLVFETVALDYRYPDGRTALVDLSLQIYRGERVALLGANGSGKTTLLLNLLGLLTPSTGVIRAFGEPLSRSAAGLKQLRSRVGLVFQNPDSQLLSASVAEDVSFGPMNLGLDRDVVRARVAEALASVGMAEFALAPVHALSFGQKKRVCIAGILAMRPEVLLLDEPTTGLDAPAVEELLGVLARLHADGMTIVLATHDIDLAFAWADRALVLDRGRLAASCTADEFADAFPAFTRYGLASPRVAEIFLAAREAGLIPPWITLPRTHSELLAALACAPSDKLSVIATRAKEEVS